MTKWEYYIESALDLTTLEAVPAMGKSAHGCRQTLDQAGEHGWEAFAAWPISSDGRVFCVLFKRPTK